MGTLDRRQFALGLMAGAGLGIVGAPGRALASWEPSGPIEFVIMAGEGGGADRLARFIIGLIDKYQLSTQPFMPVNKGAGSGAEALMHLKLNAGNPHVILATLNSLYTTPLRKPDLDLDIGQFTPVVTLAIDSFLLWVNAESDIHTLDQYVARVKQLGPVNWTMGGTGSGQEDSLVTAMLEGATGIEHSYKPYKGGGSVAKALAANQIQSTVNNPSEQMELYQAGKTRPIAAFTPKRLEMFPDVPTFRELGHDLVYFMQRGVMAPGKISVEALTYYEKVFSQVERTPEWREYAHKKSLARHWLKRSLLKDFVMSERASHVKLLQNVGFI